MKKEFLLWLIFFILLSLVMHFDEWITNPLEHILKLKTSGAYGLGFLHPIVFTTTVYVMILIPRFIISFFKNIHIPKKDQHM